MSAVAELEEEQAVNVGVDLAAPHPISLMDAVDWARVNVRLPIAFLPYEPGLPPIVRLWPETPERRLASVPEDLQQLLIERGRVLERREQAQRELDAASARLCQLDMIEAVEAARRQEAEAQQQTAHEQRVRDAWLEMQMRFRSAWVGHGVCCTPGRDEI
jgi:hypothetical protein